eukprot:14621219-Heterocapsa_arctica.AAC.1
MSDAIGEPPSSTSQMRRRLESPSPRCSCPRQLHSRGQDQPSQCGAGHGTPAARASSQAECTGR